MLASEFALDSTYLNSAYLGPSPRRARLAVERFAEAALNPTNLPDIVDIADVTRAKFAELLGVPTITIALSTSVSELVSHVANGLEVRAGDEILLLEGDFPSMILPWLVLAESKGVHVRRLPVETFLDPEAFRRELHDRTRLAACSHVMFNTGTLLPLAELGRHARANGSLFLGDTSQSFGGMPITRDIVGNVDILVGVAYKWLCGPYGSAFGYFSERALNEVQRTHASWIGMPGARSRTSLLEYSTEPPPGAARFDRGQSGSGLINVALTAALELWLECGLDAVRTNNAGLVERLLAGLPSKIRVLGHDHARSNIICLSMPEPAALSAKLGAERIDVSLRQGAIRVSLHAFNSSKDVDLLLQTLGA